MQLLVIILIAIMQCVKIDLQFECDCAPLKPMCGILFGSGAG